jgi:hypothetical protein
MEKGLSSLIEKIANKHWFEGYLEKAFLASERTPKAINYFYAGWAGQCPKRVQLMMNGIFVYKPTEFRNRKAFEYGEVAHERYQKAMKQVGKEVASEVVLKQIIDGVTISGRADLIVIDPDGKKKLIELKTINGTEFKDLKAPKGDHLSQWTIYSYMLDIQDGLIIYENKDDKKSGILPDLKIFEVSFNKDIFDKIIADFKMIISCNDKNELVTRPAVCTNPYCEIKTDCLKGK